MTLFARIHAFFFFLHFNPFGKAGESIHLKDEYDVVYGIPCFSIVNLITMSLHSERHVMAQSWNDHFHGVVPKKL